MNTKYRITAQGIDIATAHGIVHLVLRAKRTATGSFNEQVPILGALRHVNIHWAGGNCACSISD